MCLIWGQTPNEDLFEEISIVSPYLQAFGHNIQETPPLQLNGSTAIIEQVELTTEITEPPSHHNDYTLLLAMEEAGNHGTGIGTPATRADTIELLIERGYLKRTATTLTATQKGQSVIQQVPFWLKSPNTTSQWEENLNLIASAEEDPDAIQLRDHFTLQQKEKITQLLQQQIIPKLSIRQNRTDQQPHRPTERMIQFAQFIARRQKITPPNDYKTNYSSCHSFIRKHRKNRPLINDNHSTV